MNAGPPSQAESPPDRPPPRRCQAKNARGKPCRAPPLKDGQFCRLHDPRPEVRAEVKAGAVAGGKQRTAVPEWQRVEITDRASLMTVLNEVINQVAGGAMTSKTSYALVPHLANMVQLIGAEPRQERGGVDAAALLTPVLEVLDGAPDAKAELVKRLELIGK